MLSAARPAEPDHYLAHCPSLSRMLAAIAEESDSRPLLRQEREQLTTAIWDCAAAIRQRRPKLAEAYAEGRMGG